MPNGVNDELKAGDFEHRMLMVGVTRCHDCELAIEARDARDVVDKNHNAACGG